MKWIIAWISVMISVTMVQAQDRMRMAVTTSFHNSGLSDILLPAIQNDLGLDVQLLVVGTGQALKLGREGDVDAVLVHSRAAEDAFLEGEYGTHRREIMYNDFVIVGPRDDPAKVGQTQTVRDAFRNIAAAQAIFVSRGDDSGTHKKEQALWVDVGQDEFGPWYRAVGSGMGAALNTASGMNAYILSDRASWLKFGNKGELDLLFQGDPSLFNQYAYLPVNPKRHAHVDPELTNQLEAWLTSDRARELIDGYRVNGEKLFTFNAQ